LKKKSKIQEIIFFKEHFVYFRRKNFDFRASFIPALHFHKVSGHFYDADPLKSVKYIFGLI